jgi:glycerol-3-phosphate acyltransferase PlsY
VYPVYLGFSGGKGVATSCGVYAVLAPTTLLAVALIFFLVAGLTRYVSAGSLAAALSLPLGCWFVGGRVAISSLVGLAVLNSLLVLWTHLENLKRLIRGEELPFYGESA